MSDSAATMAPSMLESDGVASAASSDTLLFASILIGIQILDGILTGFGVKHFGHGIEANVLIRTLMDYIGYVNALVVVKSLAIGIVIALYHLAAYVSWINRAIKMVIILYLCAAIIPWMAILLHRVA